MAVPEVDAEGSGGVPIHQLATGLGLDDHRLRAGRVDRAGDRLQPQLGGDLVHLPADQDIHDVLIDPLVLEDDAEVVRVGLLMILEDLLDHLALGLDLLTLRMRVATGQGVGGGF